MTDAPEPAGARAGQDDALLGTQVGPYRLTHALGRGGAGVVYLGERVDQRYNTQVAVKIVQSPLARADIGLRFEAERQILANLRHPHIAQLLDAGQTAQGLPYLVMEYVRGEPIDRYCEQLRLNTKQRIELFLKVCDAVQYAHAALTVHRDLKPDNILIDASGQPKLLDFGAAKLLEQTDETAPALTRLAACPFTPEYASPEQVLGQPITTATDVYSLGIVLYELLTGARPYAVTATSILAMEAAICHTQPTRPSTALRQTMRKEAERTPKRHAQSRLGADIDAILLCALRKEPELRYPSVAQFADDLRRHLSHLPVAARHGSRLYTAQRFVRRHLVGASLVAGLAAAAITALFAIHLQSQRYAVERDLAVRETQASNAVSEFMINVFDADDARAEPATASSLLAQAERSIQTAEQLDPIVKARLLEAIGQTYTRQGQPSRGVQLISQALQTRSDVAGAADPALAPTMLNLGKALLDKGAFDDAERLLQATLRTLEAGRQTASADYAMALNRLAELERQRGRLDHAVNYHRRALPLMRAVYGAQHSEYAGSLLLYGSTLMWMSRVREVEPMARQSVDIYRAVQPETHPDRIAAEQLLGECLLQMGKVDEAAPLLENSYRLNRQVYGDASARLASSMTSLFRLRDAQNRTADAERITRAFLAIMQAARGERDIGTAQAHDTLGIALWRRHNLGEAETQLRAALATYRASLPADHLNIASAEHFLAEVLLAQKRVPDAIVQLETVLARLQRAQAAPWRIARSENTLGAALLLAGKPEQALPYLEKSMAVLSTSEVVSVSALRLARERLQSFSGSQGSYANLHAVR